MGTSADLLASVLDGVPHPVWVVGHDGLTVYANPASLQALGYDGAALEGLPSHRTIHVERESGSACPEDECPMVRPRLTGERAQGEDEWFARRDGSMFPLAWSSSPIELAGGLGAVLAFTDITERKAADRAVRDGESAEARAAEMHEAQRRAVENEAVMRQNIARDLHDGAQQRLVVLLVALQLAREELGHSPARAVGLLGEATNQAQLAVDELRELAARIHPAILTNRGLNPAVEGLAGRSALPVRVVSSLEGRLPAATEAGAYYFVADALDDAVNGASASRVDITISSDDTTLSIEISDDGLGGAHRDGDALARLAHRVSALDGTFSSRIRLGEGTVLRAELPISRASSSTPTPDHER